MSVTYKSIPDIIDRYCAGDDGNVYSLKRGEPNKLKPAKCSKGNYSHIWLTPIGKKRKQFMTHVVICSAFHGKRPSAKHQAAHLDGNSLNNLPSNLAWKTIKDNHADKIIHGTDDNGLKNSRAKLDKDKLFVIRWLLTNTNFTHERISGIVDENRAMISKVANKSRYSRSIVSVIEEKLNG